MTLRVALSLPRFPRPRGRPSSVPGLALVAVLLLPSVTIRGAEGVPAGSPPVDFDRQVRPILAENCYACHGPDGTHRKADLRLDRESAGLSDRAIVVPGRADESGLVERVVSEDPATRMPPPKTGKRLTPEQVRVLRRWIDGGAGWSRHWSFVRPRKAPLPRVKRAPWARNAVDRFLLSRLESEGMDASPEADRATLVRRLTLDLTGLPPTLAEIDDFLNDPGPDAYERVVDRLLASPHYGERVAVDWLDAARYADTHGYQRDGGRDMTRWRTWVIDALNDNLPFDRFTVEQIAGDLLPGATVGQTIASGFHRNHMINVETGAVPEEYLAAYVADRVDTTGTVWLGLTLGCARCHDHKFDPVPQKDYYRLAAFFNGVPENGIDGASGNAAPVLALPTPRQQREIDRLAGAIRTAEGRRKGKTEAGVEAARRDAELSALRKSLAALEAQVPTAMVMREMPRPRDTFVLVRGQYDRRGERVAPGVPSGLPPLPEGAPANRLGLARWLVDRGNPLTARVTVNRYWQMVFGAGIVRTADDFGAQGEPPSHPELLDWLAVEFMEGGWDVKRLLRLLVTSSAYRQSSAIRPGPWEKDPENRLLTRGPRFRLQAEFLRDQALAVSGLLDGRFGGPPVFPYQPPGLWEELCSRLDGANFSAQVYTPGHGGDLYRRSLYTFWKRTSPPPSLTAFDAPDRETCAVRRARTNTPLQALVMLSDPTYVEAARKLAERMMTEADGVEGRITHGFRAVTARTPAPAESKELRRIFEAQLAAYRRDRGAAVKLLGVGESGRRRRLDPAELASWTVVASVLLNLDEAVTKG